MGRLLVICAVTAFILVAFAAQKQNSTVAAAGGAQAAPAQLNTSAGTAGIVSASKVSVVASGLAPRALALNPLDPNATIDLTNAGAPNQVFTLGAAAASGFPAANLRLAAIAGTGAAGSLGDGGAAPSAEFNLVSNSLIERSEITVATDGTIFIADTSNATIRAIAGAASSEPGVIRSVAGRWAAKQNVTLAEPLGIALDRAGNLYIADHAAGAVDVLASANGHLATLAQIAAPASIAVTPNGGTVYVASPDNGQVFAVNTQTRAIDVVAGVAAASLIRTSSESSACADAGGPPTQQICPAGLAVDGAANLFIADANSGRILRVDARTGAQTLAASGLSQPGAMAFDASGNLYVAEQGLNRIVAFAQAGSAQSSITLSPVSGAFGNEPVGGATATQQFALTNSSSGAVTGLTIPKTTSPADFTVESNSCTTTLAANSSCTLNVAFTPTVAGVRSESLTVTDSASTDSASASFTGTGDDYEIQLASNQLMSISVAAGSAATFNLQVVPDNVFSGTVTLVCPGNLPSNTTCTFSSATLNVSAGSPAPFQVTFQTTGILNPLAGMAPHKRNRWPPFPFFPALVLVGIIFAVLLALIPGLARNVLTKWDVGDSTRACFGLTRRLVLPFALFALAVAFLAGCHSSKTNESIGATPAGTSTLAITGNSQNASRALTITLNVVAE